MVRVALVGLGVMGKAHMGVYVRLDNAEVTALHDLQGERMEIRSLDADSNIKASSGEIDLGEVRKYTDYETMLREGGFDIVDICLPTFLHAEYTVRALEHGYHVFCEKPMALTVEETSRMLDAERSSGRLFSVGQCLRFWPAYSEVKKLIDKRIYGELTFAEFGRYSARPGWSWDNWLHDAKRSGSAALDLHIHDVDMVLWLFGKPRSVRSTGVFERDGGISQISTIYAFDGKVVTATGGWNFPDSFPFNMQALYVFERGAIEMDFSKDPVVTLYPQEGNPEALTLPEGDGYFHELADFTRGVETGKPSAVVTGESAAESVALCRLEIESAKSGRELQFE